MTTLYVDDFKLGLDLRKSVLTAPPGSLQTLNNCVITPGGEIEKRKAFVQVYALPVGATWGLHGTVSGTYGTEQLWTFSQGAAAPAQVQLGSTSGAYPVPLWQQKFRQQSGEGANYRPAAIYGVREYGSQQFFVSAATYDVAHNSAALMFRNFWLGEAVPAYVGYAPLVSGQKMYRVANSIIYFSGVGDPSVTNPLNPGGTGPNTVNPGAGFIDTAQLDAGTNWLVGMEAYYKNIAIFSRRVCLIYSMDPDASKNALQQVLRIGAVTGGSILQFGTGDVLFLSDSGIRSLRALTASLAAGVNDVGSPIDPLIQVAVQSYPITAYGPKAIIEPLTGRYWLAIGNTIYVLSYWPSAKISAWSTFTLPFSVDEMAVAGNKVFVRGGDAIYQYGGSDGNTYDTSVATVQTPLMPAETPNVKKKAISISAMLSGNWAMSVCMDPDNPSTFELSAYLGKSTYAMNMLPFAGYGSHIGFLLTTNDASAARLGALSVRFDKANET